ncbi:hypothetical protein D3C85_1376220 [compost metagenome]
MIFQQIRYPAALPLPHPQLHQPLIPDDLFALYPQLLTHQQRRLTGTAQRAGIDAPMGRLGDLLPQTGSHGAGLRLAPGGQIRVAAPLQPLFGVVARLTVA